MLNFYALQYKNYANRSAARLDTFEAYRPYIIASWENTNFNFNDGINAQFKANELPSPVDYALVLNTDTNTISRWYIIESVYMGYGQYMLGLLRDVVADFQDEILNSSALIERAMLTTNNNLIFNTEGRTYNEIKQNQILLKDESATPWIVGYVANSLESKAISTAASNVVVDYPNYTSWEAYEFAQYDEEHPYVGEYNQFSYAFYFQENQASSPIMAFFDENNNPAECLLPIDTTYLVGSPYLYPIKQTYMTKSGMWRKIFVSWAAVGQGVSAGAALNEFDFKDLSYAYSNASRFRPDIASEGGKIIQIGDKYYEIIVNTRISEPKVISVANSDPNISHWDDIVYNMDDVLDLSNTTNTSPHGGFVYNTWEYVVDKREIDISSIDFTIGADRTRLTDAPYSMFAMPAQDISFTVNDEVYNSSGYLTYRLVQNMIVALDSELYDIQLLPYSPLKNLEIFGGNLFIPGTEGKDFVLIKDENNTVSSLILWLSESSFSRTLNYTIPKATSAIDLKVQSECDKYRIVSPTYGGIFEFSAAKNGGVTGFNVFCTYKPFSPFIKIAPIFSGLYGQDFTDARGCVCQGDFSLPQINDKWVEYQLNNKNYSAIFQTQIDTMDKRHSWDAATDITAIVANTIAGAGSGAAAGALTGAGIPGAIVGGVVGGAGSLIAGVVDAHKNAELRAREKEEAIMLHNLSLGNIKAMPYSLANIGAQTIISNLWPMLEYYSCTEEEKELLRDYLKKRSMRVGAIDNVGSYKQSVAYFLRAQIILIPDLVEDYHIAEQIISEMQMGVYL